jgi:hypothetical protein
MPHRAPWWDDDDGGRRGGLYGDLVDPRHAQSPPISEGMTGS